MNTQFIDYLGARLVYRRSGTTGAPVLVLLHGGLGSSADFDAVLPALQQQFDVIAVDSRGHGRSTMGGAALTYAQLADDVRVVLDKLGIQSCGIFGFSDGGITAYRLAASDKRVAKIITVGAHWHVDNIAAIRGIYEALDEQSALAHMPQQCALYRQLNPEADLQRLLAALKTMWLDEGETGYPNERIRSVAVPVLAMRGEADFLLSLADMAALQPLLPNVHLMNIPFAAHEAVVEQPEMVMAAVAAFYRQEAAEEKRTD